jgi:murein L,D-transpeptidase YafK
MRRLIVFVRLAILLVIAGMILFPNDACASLKANVQADFVKIEKSKHVLSLFKKGKKIAVYRVSLGRGGLGAKQCQGDKRTPEGRYKIAGRNPNSKFHLALLISYPEEKDIENARRHGVPTGGEVMIHGVGDRDGLLRSHRHYVDWTEGCIAVTNREIEEIWRAVPDGTPVEILP